MAMPATRTMRNPHLNTMIQMTRSNYQGFSVSPQHDGKLLESFLLWKNLRTAFQSAGKDIAQLASRIKTSDSDLLLILALSTTLKNRSSMK